MDSYLYKDKFRSKVLKSDRKGDFRVYVQGNITVRKEVCVIPSDKPFCGTWLTFRNRDEFNQIKHEYGLTEIYPDNL